MIIEGSVLDLRKGTLFLQKYNDSLLVTIDSIEIRKNGIFKFKTKINEPEIFHLVLKIDDGDSLNDRITFFGEKGNIKIRTRLKTFQSSVIIQGSKNNDLLEEYKSMSRKFNAKNLELYKLYLESQKNQNIAAADSFKIEIDNLLKRRYLYTINFANTNAEMIVSPYIVITEGDKINPSFLDTIAKKMPINVKKSKYGKSFFKILERNKLELNKE